MDSGSYNEDSNDSTNYGKMATAIATVKHEGTEVALPLINEAKFGFSVDAEHNRIYFSLKAMNGLGTEAVQTILANRPYSSIEDFGARLLDTKLIKKSQMLQLIKGGCFTELHNSDRQVTMDWFLRKYVFTPCEKLTMSQFEKLKELDIIPEEVELAVKMANFKKYVLDKAGLFKKHIIEGKKIPKRGYHDGYYILDDNSQPFFLEHFSEDSVVDVHNEYYVISEKKFTKEIDGKIQVLKDWMSTEDTLKLYNDKLYQQLWDQHASGTVARWSMQALSFYDQEHELEHVNNGLYGIVNYFDLPEEPEAYDYYTRWINGERKAFPKFNIVRIAGTVLNADNNHHMVALLTKYGVVNVKFTKGHYAFYNKRISKKLDENSDKKKVIEESWLQRGSLLIISGVRRGDQFSPLIYNDTIYKHRVTKIVEVYEDGTLLLQSERAKV